MVGVSVSKGGSRIDQWQPGGDFLQDAIARLDAASEFLAAGKYRIRHRYMLWCQGESDGDIAKPGEQYQTPRMILQPLVENAIYYGIEDSLEKCTVRVSVWEVLNPSPTHGGDYFDILSRVTAQGDMPDLIQIDYQYITAYTENGSLADLRPFVEDGTIRTEEIDGAILESGVIDGRLSGIVLGTAILSMVCNPAVFEEAGLPLPDGDWGWHDFADICIRIKERTGKYGAAMTPVLDLNLYHYWVRQHGEDLFSPDGRLLGYEDDGVYMGYVELFKGLMECGAVPDSDSWAAISVRGQEQLPVVTGECGLTQEWNNFPVRMSYVNDGLKLITPPLAEANGGIGGEDSPENAGMEADQANEAEGQGDVRSGEAAGRDSSPGLWLKAVSLCGDTSPPEPAAIDGINVVFAETANALSRTLTPTPASAGCGKITIWLNEEG